MVLVVLVLMQYNLFFYFKFASRAKRIQNRPEVNEVSLRSFN